MSTDKSAVWDLNQALAGLRQGMDIAEVGRRIDRVAMNIPHLPIKSLGRAQDVESAQCDAAQWREVAQTLDSAIGWLHERSRPRSTYIEFYLLSAIECLRDAAIDSSSWLGQVARRGYPLVAVPAHINVVSN